jgi:predicted ester cyclase
LEENKLLVKSFIEQIFNKHDLSAIEKYLKPTLADSSGKTVESFKDALSELFSGFPDLHVNIEHILAEDNRVMVLLNFNGTHKGYFQGKSPTNKSVLIRSADLYRIDDGKIAEHWDVVDQLDLLQKTGMLSYD